MYEPHPNDFPSYHELRAENARLRAVVRDLLESYLASFNGNKDELVLRAEKLLGAANV